MNIRNQYCPNDACEHFGQMLAGNVVVHSRKQRRFQCSCCKRTWVEHRHEEHYGLKTGERKIFVARYLINQGEMSIREIARVLALSPSTVQRFKKRIEVFVPQQQGEFQIQ